MNGLLRSTSHLARPAVCGLKACPVLVSRPVRADVRTRALSEAAGPGAAKLKPFVGTNCYYLLERAIKGEWKCVDDTLDFVHKTGFNVLRIWAFNDGEGDGKLQATRGLLDPKNEKALKAFDTLLDKVEAFNKRDGIVAGVNDIKLMMTLTNCVNDYGGMQQYVRWAWDEKEKKEERRPGPGMIADVKSPDGKTVKKFDNMERFEFFIRNSADKDFNKAADTAQGYFMQYVEDMVKHCKDKKRTCIHSWDICNEPRNKKTPNDNRAVGDWVHKVAEKIKETDHKSLVTIGSEGFFGPKVDDGKDWQEHNPNPNWNEGCNWIYECKSPYIDFVCIHAWADQWKDDVYNHHRLGNNPEDPKGWLEFNKQWLERHIEAAAKELGGKPLVLQEYNMPACDQRTELFELVGKKLTDANSPLIGVMCWMLAANGAIKPEDADPYTMLPGTDVKPNPDLVPLNKLCNSVNLKPPTT